MLPSFTGIDDSYHFLPVDNACCGDDDEVIDLRRVVVNKTTDRSIVSDLFIHLGERERPCDLGTAPVLQLSKDGR